MVYFSEQKYYIILNYLTLTLIKCKRYIKHVHTYINTY